MNSLLAWYIIGSILGLFLIGFMIWFGICVVSILNDIADSLEELNHTQRKQIKDKKTPQQIADKTEKAE